MNRRQSKAKLKRLQDTMWANRDRNRNRTHDEQVAKENKHEKLKAERFAKREQVRKNKIKLLRRWRRRKAKRDSEKLPTIHMGILKMFGKTRSKA